MEKLIDISSYLDWLKNEIAFSKVGEYYEISSPFLDEKNDYMQFYVKQTGNDIYFTDDGYTLNELESVGVPITGNRKKTIIRNFKSVWNKTFWKRNNYDCSIKKISTK